MSYPQPDSNKPVLVGQDYFRLKTALFSQGDIYESQQSGRAFAIGPDSDISQVAITYFDETNSPTFVRQATITPQRMLSGLVIARNEPTALYQPSKRQGRILISPIDLWDPNYLPSSFTPNADKILMYAPVMDVFEYFSAPPALVPSRSDRLIQFQSLTLPAGISWMVFPSYGRSYINMNFTNRSGQSITFVMLGVNFTLENPGDSTTPTAQETQLVASGSVANNAASTKVVKSSTDGIFDAIVCGFSSAGTGTPIAFKMLMSDTPR